MTHQRSSAPLAALLVQCAIVGFALVGVVEICLLGSKGVARPNTLLKVTLPQVQDDVLWRFNEYCDYIVVGWPLDGSNAPRIQIADQFGAVEDIGAYAQPTRGHCERIPPKRTMVIYADARVPMGIITAIKQEMRKVNQLRVCYAVTPVSWRCWPGPGCLPS